MKLWSWSAGPARGMVAAKSDYDARILVRKLVGGRERIWLTARKSGEQMPSQPCVVMAA